MRYPRQIYVDFGQQAAPVAGPPGPQGPIGLTGATGPQGPGAIGAPTSRSLNLSTAYQATDPSKPAVLTVNITSTATLTISGGQTNSAEVLIGSTTAVASGTGSAVGRYSNALTGTVLIGVSLDTTQLESFSFALPAGWYFAVRQTAGTVTITSAFDQPIG